MYVSEDSYRRLTSYLLAEQKPEVTLGFDDIESVNRLHPAGLSTHVW